jgi:K(+)-stimulated pyrophosphate-energized sodium pump
MYSLTKFAPLLGIIGLIVAWIIYVYIKKQSDGSETMREIAEMIHRGAMVILEKEYSILVIFIVLLRLLLGHLLHR